MTFATIHGWETLRHCGLMLDAERLRKIAQFEPEPIQPYCEWELRRLVSSVQSNSDDVSAFVTFVLQKVCGFSEVDGTWRRGKDIPSDWGRAAVTGETIKPRQLWTGSSGGLLPVFFDKEKRIGIGRGRKAASNVLQWLRSGTEKLAILTNGHQWRLIFAGLDFDAWCEWDIDLWLEEGGLSPQVSALRTLLSPKLWIPPEKGANPPLLQAVLDSRKGQSDISAVLGERVREAVELLVQDHGEVLKDRCVDIPPAEIYRAAVRVVMRMVFVFFAESRELLPCDHALYHGSYGLGGLLEELEKVAARGGNRLSRSWSAWPRVISLFRLVYQGSHHQHLPVPAYGGELFVPGNPDAVEGLQRALAVFETACFNADRGLMSDSAVHRILQLITRTKIKVRQGRSSTWVPAPVDFSDLSSEYIGILYEGLLDFELRTAPAGDPVIFLAVGNQPALPLSRLEGMDDRAIANLLEKMKDSSSDDEEDEEAVGEEETEEEGVSVEEEEAAEETDEGEGGAAGNEEQTDARHTTRTRAETWARRAVEVGGLARRPRGTMTPEKHLIFENTVATKARQLVTHVILPGEWYLVRWGGTRKGSGTFYTRPGLAVPTVHRTLRPLAFDAPIGNDGKPDRDAPPVKWTAKRPEEILALKVCDPACGSGSFPVAALRFLTEAMYSSLHHHGRISKDGERSLVRLLTGEGLPEGLGQELLPCTPDADLFEPRLKAIIRRYIVERCIYGVEIDPLAVELCRLSLWVETMDKSLPFSFLDHKIKCGNSLVGAWFDQFQYYPVMAWKNREGGDKSHTNGVHFEKEARTKAIKAFTSGRLKSDIKDAISGQITTGGRGSEDPALVHEEALAVLSRLHELPVQDTAERARIYREELVGSKAYQSLKSAMDLWCACWFWPADDIEHAPLPTMFAKPSDKTRTLATRIAAEKRFFHWEIEFPDVFRTAGSGFDAILGNPPWNIAKPNSKEFFSNLDPLYRSYGKQEALRYQTQYFADEVIERAWLNYSADFRAQSNFMGHVASPFGDPVENEKSQDRFGISRGRENDVLHAGWRSTRATVKGFADATHPFRYQGSADLNLYKTFLEQAYTLLRIGGRMGFIVPSGLYSDHGTGELRTLLLDRCRWEWLFGFENRDGIFEIHRSFKFNPIIIEKGGKTQAIRTAFMRRRIEDWEQAESLATHYTREQVDRFSPISKTILEIQSVRDPEILERIYSNSVLLGDDSPNGCGVKYATEFHMTNDANLFPPRPKWEAQGYRPDEYGRWLKGNWRSIETLWAELGVKPLSEGEHRSARSPYDRLPIARAHFPVGAILSRDATSYLQSGLLRATSDLSANGNTIEFKQVKVNEWDKEALGEPLVALPVYVGKMIGLFDAYKQGWVRGAGRGSVWRDLGWHEKVFDPDYLMGMSTYSSNKHAGNFRVGFIRISTAIHFRTFIAAIIPPFPAINTVPVLWNSMDDLSNTLMLLGATQSFCFDFCARRRIGYLDITKSMIDELPMCQNSPSLLLGLPFLAALSFGAPVFSPFWLAMRNQLKMGYSPRPALCTHERLRMRAMLDAVFASIYGLDIENLRYLFQDCDHPNVEASWYKKAFDRSPKGFWRVDQKKPPELRHTVLTLVAFHNLEEKIRACGDDREKGIAAFLSQNDGEGWMLPETLRLADYGLGHDERAKEPQPVASSLGPRFYDWQLAQSPEESWRECHLHARNLLGEEGYKKLLEDIEAEKRGETNKQEPAGNSHVSDGERVQRDLF